MLHGVGGVWFRHYPFQVGVMEFGRRRNVVPRREEFYLRFPAPPVEYSNSYGQN